MTFRRFFALLLVAVLVAVSPIVAQVAQQAAPPAKANEAQQPATATLLPDMQKLATPALSDVQKLQLQNLAQAITIAQLRAQQAERDFADAREAITKLVQSLQLEGWTLDLQTLSYTKAPAKPVEKPKVDPEKK